MYLAIHTLYEVYLAGDWSMFFNMADLFAHHFALLAFSKHVRDHLLLRQHIFGLFLTHPHCSYLDIYISQNIRLCKGDFEGKFQTILQAKGINFLI